eukprot:3722278-Prymnesium_polylepis.1
MPPTKPVQLADAGDVSTRIVGGSPATPFSVPWLVALLRWGSPMCGASYISGKWILSAAHCCDGASTYSLSASVYRHDLSRSPTSEHPCAETIPIVTSRLHPSYSSQTLDADICLLEMQSEPRCTIQGPSFDSGNAAGDNELVTIAGWGGTVAQPVSGSVPQSYSSIVRTANVPLLPRSRCAFYSSFTNNMICAGYESGGVDSCQGDSGGPAFVSSGGSAVLIGVVSFGFGCAQA